MPRRRDWDLRVADILESIDAMRAMRNFVIHEYFGVSKEIIWRTLTEDLPPLIAPLNAILRRES